MNIITTANLDALKFSLTSTDEDAINLTMNGTAQSMAIYLTNVFMMDAVKKYKNGEDYTEREFVLDVREGFRNFEQIDTLMRQTIPLLTSSGYNIEIVRFEPKQGIMSFKLSYGKSM